MHEINTLRFVDDKILQKTVSDFMNPAIPALSKKDNFMYNMNFEISLPVLSKKTILSAI